MPVKPAVLAQLTSHFRDATVAVVEPTENYRVTLKRYLDNLRCKEVKFLDRVSDLKLMLRMHQISLLIVEWKLNDELNGIQFCREIRKDPKLRDVPFLLLSVESLRRDVVLASEVGIDGFLLKPFSYEDFLDQLSLVLSQAEQRNNFRNLVEKAEKLLEEKEWKEAQRLFEECSGYNLQSARVRCGLGRVFQARNDHSAALRLFKSAIEANASYLEAYRLILELYDERNEPHHILHYGLKAHELSPDNPRYMLQIAKAYLQIGDLEASEKFYRLTIRNSPRLAAGHKGLGDVHMLKEDYDSAMEQYTKALDLDSTDVGIINSMGLVYVRKDLFDEAIVQYKLALQIEPDNARVLFNLGHAYEKTSAVHQARRYYNQALIHEPDFDKPRRGLERLSNVA